MRMLKWYANGLLFLTTFLIGFNVPYWLGLSKSVLWIYQP